MRDHSTAGLLGAQGGGTLGSKGTFPPLLTVITTKGVEAGPVPVLAEPPGTQLSSGRHSHMSRSPCTEYKFKGRDTDGGPPPPRREHGGRGGVQGGFTEEVII